MTILEKPRRETFAQHLAAGKSQSEAYSLAGYSPDDGHAARLAGNGRVKARVAELQAAGAERAEIDRATVMRMLSEDRERAREAKQLSTAVRADELLGKAVGMFADRPTVAVQVNQYTKIELARWIADILTSSTTPKQIESLIVESTRVGVG